MNKVFGCAGDCDIKIHYQDTGSIHLNYGGVDKMKMFLKKNMGQS